MKRDLKKIVSQMTLEEKTCQMVTLYGYKRVLKDDLPTPDAATICFTEITSKGSRSISAISACLIASFVLSERSVMGTPSTRT